MAPSKAAAHSEMAKWQWLPPTRLLIVSVVVTMASYFPIGYHMVVLNVPHATFQNLIEKSYVERYVGDSNGTLSKDHLATLWSVTVSSWQIGSLFGAFNAFWIADRLGRKATLLLIAGSIQLAGSVFVVLAPSSRYFELLIVGRLLAGISGGIVCPILHVFISECSPDRYRGLLNSFAGFVLALGILTAMALGLPLGGSETWKSTLLMGVCLPLNILQIVIFPFFPSTPKFLYLTKKNPEKARASIAFYHGKQADVKSIFDELDIERVLADQQLPFWKAIGLKSVRLPICLSIVAGLSNSSIGVDTMDAYSTEMFSEMGLEDLYAQVASMVFNVGGIIGSTISIFVIDRICRRTLLLSMLAVCFLCNMALIFVGSIGKYGLGGQKPAFGFGLTMAILITIMEVAYGIGPGAILEGLFAEICPHKVRAAAGSLSKLAYCITNWFFVFAFPPASVIIGPFAFLIHTIPSCGCMLYFAYYLPETSRKSVAEVAGELMQSSRKMEKSVKEASEKSHRVAVIHEK